MLIGLVGLPNKGKSTFFKAATLAEVEIANRPFVTIKPNSGAAFVKVDCVDKEFNVQCNPRFGFCIKNKRFVPIELMDVAGLIEGAYKGAGLGNQFLDDLRQADAFIQIVDASGGTNDKGEVVNIGSSDPCKDVGILVNELDMWFFGLVKKGWERFARQVHQEKADIRKSLTKQLSGLKVNEDMVNSVLDNINLDESILNWSDEDLKMLSIEVRKKSKPMIIAANKIDVEGAYDNYLRLKEKFKDYMIVSCSSEAELALREAAKHELIEYVPGENDFKILKNMDDVKMNALKFIKEKILEKYGSTGVQDVFNKVVFELLKYIAVFPGGVNNLQDKDGRYIPDCFLLKDGSTALEFAFKIHTDLGRSFIRAIDVKKKMTVGKEHKLKHRDVIEIISGK